MTTGGTYDPKRNAWDFPYTKPLCLLPDDDTAAERLARAMDAELPPEWAGQYASRIIERLREGSSDAG